MVLPFHSRTTVAWFTGWMVRSPSSVLILSAGGNFSAPSRSEENVEHRLKARTVAKTCPRTVENPFTLVFIYLMFDARPRPSILRACLNDFFSLLICKYFQLGLWGIRS